MTEVESGTVKTLWHLFTALLATLAHSHALSSRVHA